MKDFKYYFMTYLGSAFVWGTACIFAGLAFLMMDEMFKSKSSVIREVKAIEAKVDQRTRFVHMRLENTIGEKWLHQSGIKYEDCPMMEYNKFKRVYIVTYQSAFLKNIRYEAEGVVTFCRKGLRP